MSESLHKLQRAASKAISGDDIKSRPPHTFPVTKPAGAMHFEVRGTPPTVTCGHCGRSLFLQGDEVVGSATETGCHR